MITISEHARQALIERLDLDPDRVRRDLPRRRPRAVHARRPARASRSCSTRRTPGRTRTTRGSSRRSRASGAERPELRLVLTGAAHDRLALPEGVESRGHVSLDELVEPLPHARRRSSTRACTRASASRASRRWPAAARWPRRTSPRSRRSAATPRVYFDPLDPESIADGDPPRARLTPGGRRPSRPRASPGRVRPRARRGLPRAARLRRTGFERLVPQFTRLDSRRRRSRSASTSRLTSPSKSTVGDQPRRSRAFGTSRRRGRGARPRRDGATRRCARTRASRGRHARRRARRAPAPSAGRRSRSRSRLARPGAASVPSPARSRRRTPSRAGRPGRRARARLTRPSEIDATAWDTLRGRKSSGRRGDSWL